MPNPYIRKRGDKWVIIRKSTGRPIEDHEGHPVTHDTKEKAEEAFRAIEMSKHGD